MTVGVGFTSTVAVIGVPEHPLAVGVIVKVTVTGALVVLVSVPLMLPLPLAAMPVTVAVLFLVQLKVVPVTLPLSTIDVIAVAEQIVCDAGVATAFGVGFTSTVAVIGVPGHPLAVGVIVKVTVTGALVVLVSVPLMLPLPLAAMPVTVAVLSLVQLKVVPVTLPLSTIVVIAVAEQIVCDAGVAIAFGVGLTVMVKLVDVPVHPLATGVTVIVAVTGVVPALTAVNEAIFPEPLAARPMEGVLFVQLKDVPATAPLKVTAVVAAPLQRV